ncbi:ABC transporter ATP-binding protein [Nocardiopsis sp. DSM 44743]|uniref:ABC transporter ATP-binding protein n=1 Tax=Nocardiopsis lambiniae TaxID=3075539 RepID=A0ABU2MB09_9ACTN|nr:ABC transporter ATP-binding protein [Nocardiopsis sp. DSM 44743]
MSDPDTRGPVRYLWWLTRAQPGRVALGSFWGVVWTFSLLAPPSLISRAVDEGLRAGDRAALLWWTGAFAGVLVVTAIASIMRHRTMTMVRTHASLHTTRALARHAARVGAPLSRRTSSGDLSVAQSLDAGRIGQILTLFGPGVGSVVACVVVPVILWGFSPLVALVVIVGLPLTAAVLAPFLGRMHTRQNEHRDREGALTTLAGDIVGGLRVLCGIGGKERFARRYREGSGELVVTGYRLGSSTSWFEEISGCAPVVFTAVITWVAARLAVAGEITVGETVAVYGYAAVLIVPVFSLVETATDASRGQVSLTRVLRLLRVEPERFGDGSAPAPEGPGELVDPESGVRVPVGSMVALVSADPAVAAEVADRLGGYVDSSVTWGGVPLRDVDRAVVRRRILVSDNDAHLFAGSLREVVDAHGDREEAEIGTALGTAAVTDVVESLPNGLDSPVEAQGRDLSGGQRQRVRLARAVLADPEVLILVEPTSAVDAHTEATIAGRLWAERRGATTVIVGTSPLLADRADRVLLLVEGRVAAEGSHGELVADRADYRALVLRGCGRGGHPMTAALPVASREVVRDELRRLMEAERGPLLRMVLVTCAAAGIGLAGPYLVGRIVDLLEAGTATVSAVDGLAAVAVVCAMAHLVLNRYAKLSAFRFGERALAGLREDFVDRVLALPARVVERSGTGDLTTRVTADVAAVGTTLRTAVPDIVPASLRILFLLAGVFWLSPLMGAAVLIGVPPTWLAVRWYLRRSRDAYLAEGAAGSTAVEGVTETVRGARTVEAFALGGRRIARADRDAVEVYRARRRTLRLRSVLYPVTDLAFSVPAVVALLVGGLLYLDGRVALGVVVTCCLYMLRVQDAAGWIMIWIEQLQRSGASFARVFGVGEVAGEPRPEGPTPVDDRIEVRDVHHAYADGRDVLRGIDLTVRPGERWAIVGPSGAGKTTLGRLLAGSDAPRSGRVLVGGVPVADLGPRESRERIVLVSQEHHVFAGTLRENLAIAAEEADDATLAAALTVVDPDWAVALPGGLDTPLGPGGVALDPARAQRVALARVVLADPRTVILDEATSLLDPTTARHAERSLAAVLEGRTVIAIAHRLHTAHDADRIAVVEDGRITEQGSHAALVDAGGPYAALWRSWHGV